MISQLRQHFFCFYGYLYGPVFGTRYQGPEGESKQDPRQKSFPWPLHEQIPPHLEIKITSVLLPVQAAVPQTPRAAGGQGIPEHGSKSAEPGSSAALTVLQPHDNGAGVGVLLRALSSPHQHTLDPLSPTPLKGGVSQGISASITQHSSLVWVYKGFPGLTSRLRPGLYCSRPPELTRIV